MQQDKDNLTPIENPISKQWFAPGYQKPAKPASNVVRRSFGPGLPPATGSDDGPKETT